MGSGRTALTPLENRVSVLEAELGIGGVPVRDASGLIVARTTEMMSRRLYTYESQIASLQQAVAAIERRQMPLLHSEPDAASQALRAAAGEVKRLGAQRDAAAVALHEAAEDFDRIQRMSMQLQFQPEEWAPDDVAKRISAVVGELGDAAAAASKAAREARQ